MYIILEASETSNKFVKLGADETWSGLKGLAEIHFIQDPNYSSGTSHIFQKEEASFHGRFWTDTTWSLCVLFTTPSRDGVGR